MSQKYLVVVLSCAVFASSCKDWDLNLPPEHIPFYFSRFPSISKKCVGDYRCPYRNIVHTKKCWGYEDFCNETRRETIHSCFSATNIWLKDEKEQLEMFWSTADFGYIKKRINELVPICEARHEHDSSLICSRHLRFCKAKRLYLDFRKAKLNLSTDRFREDVFKHGDIGGQCVLDQSRLKESGDHKSALQSWFAELESFSELQFYPLKSLKHCDVIIDKPTIFMKLDAGVNMFHHFCDFINLYASQHINGSFDQDIQIIMWDTSPLSYGDLFEETWKAFTYHPIIHLNQFDGKQVVGKAICSVLSLVISCIDSTFRSMDHILNLKRCHFKNLQLLRALISHPRIDATMVDYNRHLSFLDQLYVTHNSDVLIGIHGAGLTHLLFLPNWGAIFELYNCEDKDCYYDLSRLRGVKYFTWENLDKLVQEDEGHHPTLGAHKKFTNYSFDAKEFMRIVLAAVDYVENHQEFIQARLAKRPSFPDSLSPATHKSEL